MTIDVKIKWFPIVVAMGSSEKVRAALDTEFKKAGRRSGQKIAALMRRKIRGGVSPANAKMTTDSQGATKPLADRGRLFKAVTFTSSGGSFGDMEIRVGVMRTHAMANVAKIVHDGRTQTVTRRMSLMFRMLWLASIGRPVSLRSERAQQLLASSKGRFSPLKEGEQLVHPSRPFALLTLTDPRTKKWSKMSTREALKTPGSASKNENSAVY